MTEDEGQKFINTVRCVLLGQQKGKLSTSPLLNSCIPSISLSFAIAVGNRSVDLQKGFPFIRFLWLRGLVGEENGGPYLGGAKR